MDKKKKLIIGTSAAAGIALLGGTFAFFYDEVSTQVDNIVGTVDMTGTVGMSHTQAKRTEIENLQSPDSSLNESANANANVAQSVIENKKTTLKTKFEQAANNLNPGDNDYIPPKDSQPGGPIIARPGTDHEINIHIDNTGTKSIKNRVVVEVTGVKNGQALTFEQLKNVKVCFDLKNTLPGVSSMHVNKMDELKEIPAEGKKDNNKIIFIFDEDFLRKCQFEKVSPVVSNELDDIIKSGLVLSGKGDNAEIEKFVSGVDQSGEKVLADAPVSGDFKLDVGIRQAVDKNIGIDGAELSFTIKLQSMQNRNTGNADWDTVFSTQINTNVG